MSTAIISEAYEKEENQSSISSSASLSDLSKTEQISMTGI